ncbi:hypothetical protein F8388_009279 [Cannabis sativa]|uniref:Uncharacterized protein n=1 Tax=Cannabis sativa TaxID=3483 RepID=A0A7J6GKB1_CANSA|nr:hypothetical protein F8388_009279 [Cannabis sativa]
MPIEIELVSMRPTSFSSSPNRHLKLRLRRYFPPLRLKRKKLMWHKLKMTVSGLTGSPSRCCVRIPVTSSSLLGCNFPQNVKPLGKTEVLSLGRSYLAGSIQKWSMQKTHLIKCAMDASYGDMADKPSGYNYKILVYFSFLDIVAYWYCSHTETFFAIASASSAIFPRINVKDPYRRLGISKDASEDEIQSARNFLIRQYAGHKPSVDAIESAHDKIIMQKFYDRKNPKIDFKKKFKDVNQSRVVQTVRSRFQVPSTNFIIKTSLTFIVLGALTVLFPTEEGPTLQCWIFYLLMAVGNILDGFSHATYTQRTKEFRGYNFTDNLFATLGIIYLSEIVSV